MNSKPLDFSKAVVTVRGDPVRIICTDRKDSPSQYEVVGLVRLGGSAAEAVFVFTKDGVCAGTPKNNLVQKTTKKWRWAYIPPGCIDVVVTDRFYTEAEAAVRFPVCIGKIAETVIEE